MDVVNAWGLAEDYTAGAEEDEEEPMDEDVDIASDDLWGLAAWLNHEASFQCLMLF